MLQLSEFVRTLRSSTWIILNNVLLIDATDKSKISSDQLLKLVINQISSERLFFAISLYPLSFFGNTLFKVYDILLRRYGEQKNRFCDKNSNPFQEQINKWACKDR